MTTAEPSPPASPTPLTVSQSIHVELPVAEAFELFTDGINEWWPLNEGYAHGGDQAREIYLEAREGGRFFERLVNGDDLQVGRVTVCEPPDGSCSPGPVLIGGRETEVDVRFVAEAGGTTVFLEHRGFERLGPEGEDMARRYRGGWPRVLAVFAEHAAPRS